MLNAADNSILTPERKAWIDNASIYELLRKWRFAPVGEIMFQGECGDYYQKVMFEKRDADPAAWVKASKMIGFF